MKTSIFFIVILLALISCKKTNGVIDGNGPIDSELNAVIASFHESNLELLQKIQDSVLTRPEEFADAYNQSLEFHEKTEKLRKHLEEVKETINDNGREMEDDLQIDQTAGSILFTKVGLSITGMKLKKALNEYKMTTADQLFFYPRSEKLSRSYFNLDKSLNRNGDTISFMEIHFNSFPKIATIATLKLYQNYALEIENQFLKDLLEHPEL